MVFSSLSFLFCFLPIIVCLYFPIKNIHWRNLILFFVSILFYAWEEPIYVLVILATILIAYLFGLLIEIYKEMNSRMADFYFILSMITCVFFLFYFKYQHFIFSNLNLLLPFQIPIKELILPVGISFYTFQVLSYLIDVYRGEVKAQANFLMLGTYVALFPQLVAGPIVRYETIEKELKERHTSLDDFANGFRRFIIGLGKKVILSNNMAILADSIFNKMPIESGTLLIWLGAIAYTFQIYFDFSGYSDMAIGLGQIFGFHFLENFRYPYIAKSITDFWHRWHISLSSWFKDYIYIPLGGNRCSKLKWLRNIFIVWLLTGLWHGANWNYICWGLYFGLLLLFEKLFFLKWIERLPGLLWWLMVMFLIIISWVIFRVEDMSALFGFLQRMFTYYPSDFLTLLYEQPDTVYACVYLPIAFFASLPAFNKLYKRYFMHNYKLVGCLYDVGCILILLICIIMLMSNAYNPFIYYRF